MTAPLFESTITSLPLLSKGKVRDIYAVNADTLLIVTTFFTMIGHWREARK